jgi:hypothetical protein
VAQLTLKKQRVSEKNGMSSFKADNRRTTGTVYFDKKMFEDGKVPETLVVIADGIVVPEPIPVPTPQAAAEQTQAEVAG